MAVMVSPLLSALVVAAVMGLESFQPQFTYIVTEKSEPFQTAA